MLTTRLTAIVLAITVPAFAPAQPPLVDNRPQPTGSGRVTGRVVADDNERPIGRALVTLSGVPDSERKAAPRPMRSVGHVAETAADGRFQFVDLPAGSYGISVEPTPGFVRPTRSTYATVTDGRTADVTIRVQRAGAIEGRIQDDIGGPLLGVQVHAVRRRDLGGYIRLSGTVGGAITDDRGRFRLFNLPAGDYYVLASRPEVDGHDRRPLGPLGYVNTYYPGAPTTRDAKPIGVRAGRDTTGVDFALARRRLASLSIHPVDSRGVPLGREAQLTLTRKDDVYLASSSRFTSRREDGTFAFKDVQPGDYYLVVTKSYLMEEAAYVNVTIAEKDVTLNVQTNTGAKVSGRVMVDGRPAGGTEFLNVSVSAFPPPEKYGPTYAQVPLAHLRGTDRFELRGLRGPMVIRGEVGLGALLSIRRGSEELSGKTVEFNGTEVIDDVVVSLTTKVSRAEVTVVGSREADVAEPVLVVMFPEDPALWRDGYVRYAQAEASPPSRRAVLAQTPESSRASLIRVPPGRYLLVAIPDPEINYPTDRGILEKLRPLARPVTLVEGETARVVLPVSNFQAR